MEKGAPLEYKMERYCSVCKKHEEKVLKDFEDLMKKNRKYELSPKIYTEKKEEFI